MRFDNLYRSIGDFPREIITFQSKLNSWKYLQLNLISLRSLRSNVLYELIKCLLLFPFYPYMCRLCVLITTTDPSVIPSSGKPLRFRLSSWKITTFHSMPVLGIKGRWVSEGLNRELNPGLLFGRQVSLPHNHEICYLKIQKLDVSMSFH